MSKNDSKTLQSGAVTYSKGFVTCFLRVHQAIWLNCSCHAAKVSKGELSENNTKHSEQVAAADCTFFTEGQNLGRQLQIRFMRGPILLPCDPSNLPSRAGLATARSPRSGRSSSPARGTMSR